MTTGIDLGNGMRAGDGIEAAMATAAIVIQTNGIARETDARGAATREIEYPCVKVNTHPHCINVLTHLCCVRGLRQSLMQLQLVLPGPWWEGGFFS